MQAELVSATVANERVLVERLYPQANTLPDWPPNARWLIEPVPIGPLRRRGSIHNAAAWTELHWRPIRLSQRRVRGERVLYQ